MGVFKIILDLMSKILLFSAWMYTRNNGQFSTWLTVIAYCILYMNFIFLIFFNVLFNSKNDYGSIQYWIGVVLSSLNSVLSFNTNIDSMLKDKKKIDSRLEKRTNNDSTLEVGKNFKKHESTF